MEVTSRGRESLAEKDFHHGAVFRQRLPTPSCGATKGPDLLCARPTRIVRAMANQPLPLRQQVVERLAIPRDQPFDVARDRPADSRVIGTVVVRPVSLRMRTLPSSTAISRPRTRNRPVSSTHCRTGNVPSVEIWNGSFSASAAAGLAGVAGFSGNGANGSSSTGAGFASAAGLGRRGSRGRSERVVVHGGAAGGVGLAQRAWLAEQTDRPRSAKVREPRTWASRPVWVHPPASARQPGQALRRASLPAAWAPQRALAWPPGRDRQNCLASGRRPASRLAMAQRGAGSRGARLARRRWRRGLARRWFRRRIGRNRPRRFGHRIAAATRALDRSCRGNRARRPSESATANRRSSEP